MTNIPKFEGTPLIPEIVTEAGFLRGNFSKVVLKEFDERVQKDFGGNDALAVLSYNPQLDVIQGSNDYATVLLNDCDCIKNEGLATATLADCERAIRAKQPGLNFRGVYVDPALVLTTDGEPNKYLAQKLMREVRARGHAQKMPYMIPLKGLKLVNDADAQHSLAYALRDDAEIIEAPVLCKAGRFKSTDIDEKTGLPTKLDNEGDSHLYTRNSGLSRLYLDGSLDLNSDDGDLQDSDGGGRVVVVRRGEAAQNFESMIRQEYDRQRERLEKRYKKALATFNEKE